MMQLFYYYEHNATNKCMQLYDYVHDAQTRLLRAQSNNTGPQIRILAEAHNIGVFHSNCKFLHTNMYISCIFAYAWVHT